MFSRKSVNLLLLVVVSAAACLGLIGFFQLSASLSGIKSPDRVHERSSAFDKPAPSNSTAAGSNAGQDAKTAQTGTIAGNTGKEYTQQESSAGGSATSASTSAEDNPAAHKSDTDKPEGAGKPAQADSSGQQVNAVNPGTAQKATGTDSQSQHAAANTNNLPSTAPPAVPKEVEAKVGSIARKKVETEDYLIAGAIILKKLTPGEIKLLFDQARDDYWVATSVEDIEKARSILFSKLSAEELETLRALGKKYGRSMDILNPNISVAETKAKQMAKKQK